MAIKTIICPACGSTHIIGYFYGKQEEYDKALKEITKNPPRYGGNMMTPDRPMYHCKDCGHDWNIPHKFPFSGEADKKAKRLRCVVNDMMSLTKGKIYEVKTIEHGAYGIIDDEEDGVYLYNPACFEVVSDMEDWSKYTGEDDSALANYDPNNPPQFTKEDREWLDAMVDRMCEKDAKKQ